METTALTRKYMAFISYSHADNRDEGRKWADWLHHALETYEIPAELIGQKNQSGEPIPNQIYPVFQDEKELSANHSLETALHTNLENSEHLVYLSSPKSANSVYVQNELIYYKQIGKASKIIALILSGEPEYGDQNSENQCFPDALRYEVNDKGEILKDRREEPLAADVRIPGTMQEGYTSPEAYRRQLAAAGKISANEINAKTNEYKERLELAKLKIIAGVLDVPLGELTKRDKAYQLEKIKRKNRNIKRIAAAISGLAVLAVILGIFAWNQRNRALTTLAFSLFSSGVNKVQNGENSDGAAYLAAATRFGNQNAATYGQSLLTSISSDYRVPNIENIYQVAYSPDGKWLCYTTNIGEGRNAPQIFNLETRKKGSMLREYPVGNFSQIFMDQRGNAYFIDVQKHLVQWNYGSNSAKILTTDSGSNDHAAQFGIAPDGSFGIVVLENGSMALIDVKNNQILRGGISGNSAGVPSFYFSENSKTIVSTQQNTFSNDPAEVKIFDLTKPQTPEKMFRIATKNPVPRFDHSGRKMIFAGSSALFAFDMDTDAAPRLITPDGRMESYISPDGKTVTVNKFDAEIYDFASGRQTGTVRGIRNISSIIAGYDAVASPVSPDFTQRLATVNDQAMMQSYVTKPLLYSQFIAPAGTVDAVCAGDSSVLISGRYTPNIGKWNPENNAFNPKFINNTEAPVRMEMLPNRKLVYVLSGSQTVRFYDAETGKVFGKPAKVGPTVKFVLINNDGTNFAARTGEGQIGIWKTGAEKPEKIINDKKLAKYLLSDNFEKIFIVENDGRWKMQDVSGGKDELQGTRPVDGVKFSGDGKNLMIMYTGGDVEIRDIKTARPIMKLKSIQNATGDFSRDGQYFAISEDVNLVRIWSVKDKKPIGESIPVSKFSGFFRFSENGSKIFVTDKSGGGALESQINIYDTKTGKSITVPFAVSNISHTGIFPGEKRVLTQNNEMPAAPVLSVWEIPGQLDIGKDRLADNLERYFGKKYDLETGTVSAFKGKMDPKEWFFQDPYSRTVTPNSRYTIMDKVRAYIPIKSVKQVEILTNNYIYHPYTRAVLAFHYAQQPETAYIADILYKITKVQLNKVKDPALKKEVEKLLTATAQKIYR